MKGLVVAMASVVLVLGGCCKKSDTVPAAKAEAGTQEKITISGAWALYPMVVTWAEEYQKLHPNVRIDVSAGGAGKGMADALAGAVDLGMVSRDVNQAEKDKGAWWASVVKDAVLPMINEQNPLAAELVKRGITHDEFRDIWVTEKMQDWNQIIKGESRPLHVFTRSDACGAAETWAKYLGTSQEELTGTAVYGDPGLAEAVRKDPLGIGFNNLNFAYDVKTGKAVPGIRAVPIDINGDHQIDTNEQFYATLQTTAAAIADGRYPSPPARNLHLVSRGVPAKAAVKDFLRWALTDGQKYVQESGYICLPAEKLQDELKKLGPADRAGG